MFRCSPSTCTFGSSVSKVQSGGLLDLKELVLQMLEKILNRAGWNAQEELQSFPANLHGRTNFGCEANLEERTSNFNLNQNSKTMRSEQGSGFLNYIRSLRFLVFKASGIKLPLAQILISDAGETSYLPDFIWDISKSQHVNTNVHSQQEYYIVVSRYEVTFSA